MRKPRVLCLMQLPPPVHGVTTINAMIAESAYLRERFELDIVPLRFAASIAELRRPSLDKAVRTLGVGAALARGLRRKPDVVYFTLCPTGLAFVRDSLYMGLIRLARVPHVLHLHAAGVARLGEHPLGRPLAKSVFQRAHVIQLSRALRSDTAWVVDDARCHFVANGLPLDPDLDPGARRATAPPHILFLSNLLPQKGAHVLIEALGRLADEGLAFEATLAGAGFDAAYLAQLRAAITARGLDGCVRYVGPAYGREKSALFARATIFALPSFDEAFPLVVIEAMQHGLAVIASDVGAVSEMLEHGRSGYVVPARDVGALAEQLRRLVVDAAHCRAIGEAGRARAERELSQAHFERALADVLATISAQRLV